MDLINLNLNSDLIKPISLKKLNSKKQKDKDKEGDRETVKADTYDVNTNKNAKTSTSNNEKGKDMVATIEKKNERSLIQPNTSAIVKLSAKPRKLIPFQSCTFNHDI